MSQTAESPEDNAAGGLAVGDAVRFTHNGQLVCGHLLQKQKRRRRAKVIDDQDRTWMVPESALVATGQPRRTTLVMPKDEARASWRKGDLVKFDGPDGETLGRIVKLNPVRAGVRCGDVGWNVPYAMLRPVGEQDARKGAERLHEVAGHARALMNHHGLAYWTFAFLESTRVLGRCDFRERVIRLGRAHALEGRDEDIEDTILHEIAHAIAGHEAGHGPAWKAVARRIGATPEAKAYELESAG